MKSKLLYVDVETTGLNHKVHAIIELAYIIEIDGQVVRRGSYKINPKTYSKVCRVSPKALECNGYKVEDFDRFKNSKETCQEFIKIISEYLEPRQRYTLVAFNAKFDSAFIQDWFEDSNQPFYGKLINYKYLDPFELVKYLQYANIIDTGISQNLEHSCKAVGLAFDAHSAVSDIEATRDLHLRLLDLLKRIKND